MTPNSEPTESSIGRLLPILPQLLERDPEIWQILAERWREGARRRCRATVEATLQQCLWEVGMQRIDVMLVGDPILREALLVHLDEQEEHCRAKADQDMAACAKAAHVSVLFGRPAMKRLKELGASVR